MTNFFSGAGNGSNCFEIYDKKRLACDIELISRSVDEMINSTGQKINYWINTTTLSSADMFYGEDTTSIYTGPYLIKTRIDLNESALALSKFGFNPDDEVTLFVTYNSFNKTFSGNTYYTSNKISVEPKSGDVFEMIEYGLDRINGRAGNFFQITEKRDQDISGDMNPLGAHYGWRLKAKRLDYTWQPNLPQESVNNQLTEDTEYGLLSSSIPEDIQNTLYWFSSSTDLNWFTLSNWYLDINHTINSINIPNKNTNVILLGDDGPIIDLDNFSLIKPLSLSSISTATVTSSSKFNKKFEDFVKNKDDKTYSFNADEFGKSNIIDSSKNNTEIYGTYDLGS